MPGQVFSHGGNRRQRFRNDPGSRRRWRPAGANRVQHREFPEMNERFSFELFEETANPPVSREVRHTKFAPGPLPEDHDNAPALAALDAIVPLEESAADLDNVFVPDHYEPNY